MGEQHNGADYYFLSDGLGSVVAILDNSGSVVRTYSYDPFGVTTDGAGTGSSAFKYTGGYWDKSSSNAGSAPLYLLGTRYYDPSIGRWTQQDPIAGSIDDPSNANAYLYVADNPTNFVDPEGTFGFGDIIHGVKHAFRALRVGLKGFAVRAAPWIERISRFGCAGALVATGISIYKHSATGAVIAGVQAIGYCGVALTV